MSVRLRHPHLADVNFVVLHHRPLTEPQFCAPCQMIHEFKAYHLRLDSAGEVVVSDEIYERLAELPNLPLTKVGKERFPKPQVMLMPDAQGREEVDVDQLPKRLHEAVGWARHARSLPVATVHPERN